MVKVIKDVKSEVEGRHVILVEDMLDTGNTLRTLIELMKHKGATTVTGMVLLDKDVKLLCVVVVSAAVTLHFLSVSPKQ